MFKPVQKRIIRENGRQAGFTLLETMVSLLILSVVAAIVMSGMVQLTKVQATVANRTQMHSSVRNATELLEQEIGQAGMVSVPTTGITLVTPVVLLVGPKGDLLPTSLAVTLAAPAGALTAPTAGMFTSELLVVDIGVNQETVAITNLVTATNTITAIFTNNHAAGVPVSVQGAFGTGIIPPGAAGGSTATVLKLYGDINSDGNMLYVEYTCDIANNTLWRNQMPFDQAVKTNATRLALLTNIEANPNDQLGNLVPCFSYQTKPVGGTTFVTNVAVTLTEHTQFLDAQTLNSQRETKETKALLNVSPRNVFNAWELASADLFNRVQPMPASVGNLAIQ